MSIIGGRTDAQCRSDAESNLVQAIALLPSCLQNSEIYVREKGVEAYFLARHVAENEGIPLCFYDAIVMGIGLAHKGEQEPSGA